MYNTTTNMYIFILFSATLAFELLITKLFQISSALPWGITIALYFVFVLYQIVVKLNEDSEKNRIKALLYELMDSINGIPIMHKNEKLIIKWDIVFKKLVDHKEFNLYDKINRMKTGHIDSYINRYPSLLMNDSIDMKESRYNIDLNSTIRNRIKKEERIEKIEAEMLQDEDCKKKLFIRDIKADAATFSNYNSSIHIDVLLKNEYVSLETEEDSLAYDDNYDGFSVWMTYKENKYNVVPRVIMHRKYINKSKWFVDNINTLLECATSIVNGDYKNILYVDNFKLINYLTDIPEITEPACLLKFSQLKNELLVFSGTDQNHRATTAYCEFKTGYNRFEVILKYLEVFEDDKTVRKEIDKIIAIGSSFQPVITMLEKMPELIKNIELTINNQDINSIVIS